MKFDKEYFIKKFEAIPDEEIGMGELDSHCALWHCGVRIEDDDDDGEYIVTPEAKALCELFAKDKEPSCSAVWSVNDNINGGSPKERILNYLKNECK